MDKAQEDIGWFMQRVPVILATMLGHTGLQNANLVVDNLPNNGN